MFKYFFLALLSALLINCGDSIPYQNRPYIPRPHQQTPHTTTAQVGHCFSTFMSVENPRQYEIFLAEAPPLPFCGKTGGKWFLNKQIFGGSSACDNWTAPPVIELTFDLQFTKLQQLQITPRGSGGFFTGNQGMPAITPVLFPVNAIISPQNRDKGWSARIPPTSPLTSGLVELYCKHCDFDKNRDMSIELKYRDRELGSFKINPKSPNACSSAETPAGSYPHHHAH